MCLCFYKQKIFSQEKYFYRWKIIFGKMIFHQKLIFDQKIDFDQKFKKIIPADDFSSDPGSGDPGWGIWDPGGERNPSANRVHFSLQSWTPWCIWVSVRFVFCNRNSCFCIIFMENRKIHHF